MRVVVLCALEVFQHTGLHNYSKTVSSLWGIHCWALIHKVLGGNCQSLKFLSDEKTNGNLCFGRLLPDIYGTVAAIILSAFFWLLFEFWLRQKLTQKKEVEKWLYCSKLGIKKGFLVDPGANVLLCLVSVKNSTVSFFCLILLILKHDYFSTKNVTSKTFKHLTVAKQ